MPEERGLKDRILDVASRMFLEYGYEGTTFQRVADELGITKGAITYHLRTNSPSWTASYRSFSTS